MQRCIHHGIDDVQPLVIAQIVRFFFLKGGGFIFCINFRMFFLEGFFASERGDPRKVEGGR